MFYIALTRSAWGYYLYHAPVKISSNPGSQEVRMMRLQPINTSGTEGNSLTNKLPHGQMLLGRAEYNLFTTNQLKISSFEMMKQIVPGPLICSLKVGTKIGKFQMLKL